MTTSPNQDLLTFINFQSKSVRVAMEKTGSSKRKVNPRKYIQKRLQPATKPRSKPSPPQTTTATLTHRSSISDVPSFTRRIQSYTRPVYNSLPSWDCLGPATVPTSVDQYHACDPDVDEALQAFGSPKAASEGSHISYNSDPFSPPSSTISESGEDIVDPSMFDRSGSPAYPSAKTTLPDSGYCSDVSQSQFSPHHPYWWI